MDRDEYKNEADALVKKINAAKERLWRCINREDYKTAATLRDQISADQKELVELLVKPVPIV